MNLKTKNKGHLMIEVLFSIALIGLIASAIMPNIITLLENQNHLKERELLIYAVNSKMEEIIGESYNNKDLNINFDGEDTENQDFIIDVTKNSEGNLNHVIVRGKRRDSDEEIKMEVYLPKEGLFTNWACPFHCHAFNYRHGPNFYFGNFTKVSQQNLYKSKCKFRLVLCPWVHKGWNRRLWLLYKYWRQNLFYKRISREIYLYKLRQNEWQII